MDEIEVLKRISAAADGRDGPAVDISARVVRAISVRRSAGPGPVGSAAAGLALLAAAAAVVVALQLWDAATDPFGHLVGSLVVVMQ